MTNAIVITSLWVSSLRLMLPSGGSVLKYVKTRVGSQTDWYLGVLGLLLNTAFKKRLTNEW